ncbi:Transcriptional regulator, AraC family [Labilithrix luteola]|uniref:Transcriptional regulator, AraC family n=1 Tax=Labilithrix luteola TaxID=1391654 RepID=A0A0K1PKA9_9BACT|nr:AraC family transcriptional regulator [Labilithrix luteola]AKU93965.1 Transcriptional regulator, AraC family [Labilithrix luteola]
MHADDPLTHLLDRASLHSELVCRTVGRGRWALALAARPVLVLHHVLDGTCVLRAKDVDQRLLPGDIALVGPHVEHRLDAGDPTIRPVTLERWLANARVEDGERVLGTGRDEARALCGLFYFQHEELASLVRALPPVLYASGRSIEQRPSFDATLVRLREESTMPKLGSSLMQRRLLEMVLVEFVRLLGDTTPARLTALESAEDDVVARAIARMSEELDVEWDVEALAKSVGVSRATLARRFAQVTGLPPIQFHARMRAEEAERLLKETDLPTTQIAESLGWSSVHAFQRAFRRLRNTTPASIRKGQSRSPSTG